MVKINDLVDRYVAVWNEPDSVLRREGIAELWAEDGDHVNQELTAKGYDAIEEVVVRAYEDFVAKGFRFESSNSADGHHNVVRLNWVMVPVGGGGAAAVGFDFVILDEDGRIRTDYQFIDQAPA